MTRSPSTATLGAGAAPAPTGQGSGPVSPAPPARPVGRPRLVCGENDSPHRSRRHLRAWLWEHVHRQDHRVATCGRFPISGEPIAVRRAPGGAHHVAGVQSCGSVWACPCCAPKVRARRAQELDDALRAHLDTGGGALLVTVTLPHDRDEALDAVWSRLGACWTRLMAGRGPEQLRGFGWVGTVRSVEVTHGANGWHVHAHAVLFLTAPVDLVDQARLLLWLRGRWGRVTGAELDGHAVDVRVIEHPDAAVAAYVTGWSAGAELARGDVKRARGGRSPMQLLTDAAEGDQGAWRAFREFLTASKGKRAVVWSRGLRGRLLGDEDGPSDDQVAAETTPDAVVVAHIDPSAWRVLQRAGAVAHLVDHIEDHGTTGLRGVLEEWGLLRLRVDYRSGPDGAPIIRGG